ncbi:MAG: DUF2764 domain-containing protein [Candidatus Omnitrophica bacterium]|nr:DUF2764 domain-containing protein [Candidatus Omnitrophota bacterium]
MSRHYYYLIASLSQLRLDDYKEPYRVGEFVSELYEHLTPVHGGYVRDILRIYDNAHIVDCVLENQKPWVLHKGNWTFDELKKKMPFNEDDTDIYLACFMKEFNQLKQNTRKISRADIERVIWRIFYSKMINHDNGFIRRYFSFDLELRNVLASFNKRKFNLSQDILMRIGDYSVMDKLSASTANDFGLSKELDYIQGLLDAFLKKNSVNIEKFTDQLRWEMIDQINSLTYFQIDVLLGYLIKLMLVERWIFLDEVTGKEGFQKITEIKTEEIYQ